MQRPFIFVFAFYSWIYSFSQDQSDRFEQIDVQHYKFRLELSDSSDLIKAEAFVTIKLKKSIDHVILDLVAYDNESHRGMKVLSISAGEHELKFGRDDDQLIIELGNVAVQESELNLRILYEGIPWEGLVISRNKYGERTFFGDNWPNRAHHWLPCVDHPSDKASVEFVVIAPEHYQVIATGKQIEESNISGSRKLSHWKTDTLLPTKVMVIGVAKFAVQQLDAINGVPLSSWVYPQDRDAGFYDYEIAKDVLQFMIDSIASYPFEKLANVQSKTRWGGMENAGNIFYMESSVTGKRQHENLIAHEIAHQWFGDSASEMDWHHVWLSEGFATYLADLYVEKKGGKEAFLNKLRGERVQAILYSRRNNSPVVDTTITDYNKVLNPNTYQKAAWILHMLRNKLGDHAFWSIIRSYYHRFQFGNALTSDFQLVAEELSGLPLNTFFQQWFFTPGHPKIHLEWEQKEKHNLELSISQVQEGTVFQFPLEISVEFASGENLYKKLDITSRHETISFEVTEEVVEINLDPNCKMFFEAVKEK